MLINRVLYVYTSTQSEKSGIRITSKSVKDRGNLNSDTSTPWLSMVPAMSKVYLIILVQLVIKFTSITSNSVIIIVYAIRVHPHV